MAALKITRLGFNNFGFGKILGPKIPLVFVLILMALFFFIGMSISRVNFQQETLKKSVNQSQNIDPLKIDINEAQFTNTIRIADKGANAPSGKNFLVISTDVENASSSAKNIIYGNYFRLEENGKKFAPLPVNAQFIIPPKATLEKQLVFIVDENKRKFNLLVGDLDKNQKTIQISF